MKQGRLEKWVKEDWLSYLDCMAGQSGCTVDMLYDVCDKASKALSVSFGELATELYFESVEKKMSKFDRNRFKKMVGERGQWLGYREPTMY